MAACLTIVFLYLAGIRLLRILFGPQDMKGIPPKLRGITDQYLESKGISVKVAPISILDDDFQSHVKTHTRTRTKAAEIEHAIRHHIDINIDDDPELYASFAEALERILQEFKDNWEMIYQELEKLARPA